MKKILYSIITLSLCLTSCIQFDDAVSENYGSGPSISVDITETRDNGFTFTLTPGEGTVFYSYVVASGSEAEELDGYALLQEQYGGIASGVLNATEAPTFTSNLQEGISPNTSYVVYAVAASQQGIVGEVTSAVVLTSEGDAPSFTAMQAVEGESAVAVSFSENVMRGTGTVTAQYFAEWSGDFVDIAAEDIQTTLEGNVVTFTLNNVPAAAYAFVSWAEGAFVDSKGNLCPAMTSGLNNAGDDFTGVYFRNAEEPFTLEESLAGVTPEEGSAFSDWTTFMGEITFNMDVYRNDNTLTGDEIELIYTNAGKTTTISSLLKEFLTKEGGFAYTIEDPTEMPLDGVYQTENGDLGLCKQTTPPNGLWEEGIKSALRSKPRYIYLGEIRSPEAAVELLRAATSGHLVLSTIHANNVGDAINAVAKYASSSGISEEMAYELMANGLLACIHQNLIGSPRKLQIEALFANPEINSGCQVRAMLRTGKLNLATIMESQRTKLERGLPLFDVY